MIKKPDSCDVMRYTIFFFAYACVFFRYQQQQKEKKTMLRITDRANKISYLHKKEKQH
jgi:hypothetical protein